VRYYDVDGVDRAEILRNLNHRGPKGYHAYTHWNVHYDFLRGMRDGQCAVLEVHTTMTSDITFPRWTHRQNAPADLIAHWDHYEAALRAHEEGHVENGREFADVTVVELAKVPPAADCATVDERVHARFSTLLKQYNQRDLDYDERTRHGRLQGAVF
jgi:predicted secreted Zn-dependent protease